MNTKSLFMSAVVVLFGISLIAGVVGTSQGAAKTGEALFKEHCAACHADGGNIMNPKKTLHKKDREANNIRTEGDIVKLMRNPGAGMSKFDVKLISDADAREIAKYVLKTYNK